jgi:PAS domain S-box-containing protein
MKRTAVDSSEGFSGDLKQQEDKLGVIIKSAPVGIGEISLEPPRFRWVNEATYTILGYKEEELLAMNPFDLIVEESKQLFQKRMKKILAGKKVTPSVDYKLKTKNGRFIWANLHVKVLHKKGKVIGGLIFAQDITKRMKAEERLKESEERFFKAFQLNPTPMAISFVDGEFIDVNCSFERLTGFTRDEVVGKRGVALEMYGSSSEREELIRKLQQEGHVYNFAITLNTKSMKQVNVLISFEKIKLQNKLRVLGAAIDVTEKQQLQNKLEKYSRSLEELVKQKTEQLREAERLAAIGQTAGMVGHDLRNPLQVIIGDLYLLESDLASMPEGEEKEGMKESIAAIKKAINYMDKIVTDLQYYAKPLKTNIQKTNLEEICQEILLEKSFPENIDVRYVIEDEAKNILAEPALLKRILNNLVDNAVQAMPDGGKLELQANREPDKVIITVQDSGVGIPEEHKDKLFTPLFTTKAQGQGFGLAVVKRITEALNGTVTFESEEGKGTKFTVRLPVAKK